MHVRVWLIPRCVPLLGLPDSSSGGVSQDVIVREHDCGTRRGLVLPLIDEDGGLHQDVETSIHGRTLAVDVKDEAGNVLATAGSDVSDELIESSSRQA